MGHSPHSLSSNFPTRILERGAISMSKASSWPRDQTCISCVSSVICKAYLFICCIRFQLQHLRFSLHHVGPFLVVYRLSELWCGLNSWQHVGCRACRFQQLWQVSLVTLQHVESWFPSWGSSSHPCTGRWILNHWTTRGIPCYYFLNHKFLG